MKCVNLFHFFKYHFDWTFVLLFWGILNLFRVSLVQQFIWWCYKSCALYSRNFVCLFLSTYFDHRCNIRLLTRTMIVQSTRIRFCDCIRALWTVMVPVKTLVDRLWTFNIWISETEWFADSSLCSIILSFTFLSSLKLNENEISITVFSMKNRFYEFIRLLIKKKTVIFCDWKIKTKLTDEQKMLEPHHIVIDKRGNHNSQFV